MIYSKEAWLWGMEGAQTSFKDVAPPEWAGPSPSHIRLRTAGSLEIPRSVHAAVFAPRGFVFLGGPPAPARSWQTAANSAPRQLLFPVAACQVSCRRGFHQT